MNSNPKDDELLRNYLLGQLPGQEADLLERRLLEDDNLFDLCEAIEADLLAASARGELALAEREQILRRLASSPQGRERLALARSLNAVADSISGAAPGGTVVPFQRPAPLPGKTFRRAALAIAASLLAAVGVSWFVLQGPVTENHAPRVAQGSPPKAGPAPVPERPVSPGTTAQPDHVAEREPVKALITLTLATLRGAEEVEKFSIPPAAEVVEIQIDVEGRDLLGTFHAIVRSSRNKTVWEGDLKPRRLSWGPVLELSIPAEQLTAGRYGVSVTAGNEETTLQFEVVHGKRG